jgi:hypothetical protein
MDVPLTYMIVSEQLNRVQPLGLIECSVQHLVRLDC